MTENPQVSTLTTQLATSNIFQKMSQVMGMLNRIPKNGRNTQQNYDFVTAADVADKVREAMSEVGLAFFVEIAGMEEQPLGENGKGRRVILTMDFTFADIDTGQMITKRWLGEAADYGDKVISKAATSGEKYFLMKTFIVSSGDEPDADNDSPEVNSHPAKRKTFTPPTPPPARPTAPTTPPTDAATDPDLSAALELLSPVTQSIKVAKPLGTFITDDLKRLRAAILSVEENRSLTQKESNWVDAINLILKSRE